MIVFIVALILLFVAQKGLATFFVNKVSLVEFLFSGDWSPSEGKFGALPMIIGSFLVTLLSALIATPFAIGAAIFMTEISPKGAKFRAFGEALAVQMVVGNSAVIPTSLTTPAATLTSVLTMGIGNTVMGTVSNNVLWSLALVLLLMSLGFNMLVKFITRERKRNYER